MTILNLSCYSNSELNKLNQKRGYISRSIFSFLTIFRYSIVNFCDLNDLKKSRKNKIQLYFELDSRDINIIKNHFKYLYVNQKIINGKWSPKMLEKIFSFLKQTEISSCNFQNICFRKNFIKNDYISRNKFSEFVNWDYTPNEFFFCGSSEKMKCFNMHIPRKLNYQTPNYQNIFRNQMPRSRSFPTYNSYNFLKVWKYNISKNKSQKKYIDNSITDSSVKYKFVDNSRKSHSSMSLYSNIHNSKCTSMSPTENLALYNSNINDKFYLRNIEVSCATQNISNARINFNKDEKYSSNPKSISSPIIGTKFPDGKSRLETNMSSKERAPKSENAFSKQNKGKKFQLTTFGQKTQRLEIFRASSVPRVILAGPYEYKNIVENINK